MIWETGGRWTRDCITTPEIQHVLGRLSKQAVSKIRKDRLLTAQ
jgi:hypothetical protein